jgi:hypothetical protein
MSKEEFLCDSCSQPMKLITVLPKHKGKSGYYRRRRYYCDLCNITKLINACGAYDEHLSGELAVNAVNKQFKKEEDARQ